MKILTRYSKVNMYTGPDGTEYIRKIGSRREVWDRVVYCTSGKLTRDCLELKGDKIISKRRSALGKQRYSKGDVFKKKEKTKEEPVVDEKASEPVVEPSSKPDAEQRLRRRQRQKRRHRRR